MQGDLYLNFRLNRQFLLYFDKGLYSGFQAFGLAKVLPLDGYLKVGQFIPAYGTKIDDHNTFIRGGPYLPSTRPSQSIGRDWFRGISATNRNRSRNLAEHFSYRQVCSTVPRIQDSAEPRRRNSKPSLFAEMQQFKSEINVNTGHLSITILTRTHRKSNVLWRVWLGDGA